MAKKLSRYWCYGNRESVSSEQGWMAWYRFVNLAVFPYPAVKGTFGGSDWDGDDFYGYLFSFVEDEALPSVEEQQAALGTEDWRLEHNSRLLPMAMRLEAEETNRREKVAAMKEQLDGLR